MIKKFILISATLLAISGCSKPQMAYEKFVEGQDVYLLCYQEGTKMKYPYWYSFDTGTEGKSTGYYWRHSNPMTRLELKDVVIGLTTITFETNISKMMLNRKTLVMNYGLISQCYAIGFQNAKDRREKHFEELTKNNRI